MTIVNRLFEPNVDFETFLKKVAIQHEQVVYHSTATGSWVRALKPTKPKREQFEVEE